MATSRRNSQDSAPAVNLQPPSPEASPGPSSTYSRRSSSAYSIPNQSSDYINSYYYGNEDMPDFRSIRTPTGRQPSWLPGSQTNSPTRPEHRDDDLLRRLSWGSHEDPAVASVLASPMAGTSGGAADSESSRPTHLRFHDRSASSADAGLVRNPLEAMFHEPSDHAHSRDFDAYIEHERSQQEAPYQVPLNSASKASFSSAPLGQHWNNGSLHDVDDSDRIVLTSDTGEMSRGSHTHFASEGNEFIRVDSPNQLEEGDFDHPLRHKSSADVYASASLAQSSPLKGAKAGLQRMSKSVKRLSRRVVHPETRGGAGHVRLEERDGSDSDSSTEMRFTAVPETAPRAQPEPETHLPEMLQTLRGKSLGIWGPESRFRKALAALLTRWWFEPLILLLIIVNTVTLIVQSSRSVYDQPLRSGYFDYTEDYILLAIFCIYTVEICAKIVVSGLVINPPPAFLADAGDGFGDNGSDSGEPTSTDEMRHEHRRKMSRSNTLDAFSEFGGVLKGQAQRAIHGSHSTQQSKHSASRSVSVGRSVRVTRQGSSDDDGRGPASLGAMALAPPGRTLTRANTTMMLPSSDPAHFWDDKKGPFAGAFVTQRVQAVNHAFLRHSWNRIDLVAVVSFWITFALATTHQEGMSTHHLYVFRALSVLRCARLLTATNGTMTILESLKMAAPILTTVAFFTAFSMVLFSIIGIQSFKGSYRRTCVWVGDLMGDPGNNVTLSQYCGGYLDHDHRVLSYVRHDGRPSGLQPKGFLCPFGQVCQESDSNPEGGTSSFDNIFAAMLQVIIVISSNNWSSTMYDMMDADYFASCLFFIIGLIIMNFWLANLFVAVITNSFATLTAQTNRSAFADKKIKVEPSNKASPGLAARRMKRVANVYKRVWGYTKYLWILTIIADLAFQASRATWMDSARLRLADRVELYLTIAFDVEILLRFLSFVLDGDWRSFLRSKQNCGDLFLAVVTSVIQIPVIKNSQVYPWLTFFQLARFYRVIAAVPRMKMLLVRVFGSMVALLNMVLFLLMMVGLASLISVQLFRGDIPQENDGEFTEMTFKHVFNSFLAMYQIFTSEDWTTVLYSVLSNETKFKQAAIGAIFLSGWFMFANFIVLQMFIAVINENFSVAEGEKRQQQLEHYLRRNEPPEMSTAAKLLHKLSPYRYLRDRNAAKTGSLVAASVAGSGGDKPRSNAIAGGLQGQGSSFDEKARKRQSMHHMISAGGDKAMWTIDTVKKVLRLDTPEEAMPLDTLRSRRARQSLSGEEMLHAATHRRSAFFDNDADDQAARLFASERMLKRMRTDLGLPVDSAPGQQKFGSYPITDHNRMQQARFIASHPSYDKSYFLFSNHNHFRRFCQSLVPSSYGERLFGRPCSPVRHKVFQSIIFAGIAGSVVSAGIATPAYRRDYYARFGLIRASWFSLLEMSLSSLFLAEFVVKTVADGVAFTPNAYVLNVWNALDLFVLVSLLINVSTELAVIGGVSRFTRALKAFRALRLINLSSLMRETFHAVMIAGAGRIVDASILSILYIIPYAVWGQNLFAGLLYSCSDSDGSIATKFDCSGEYTASPGEWSFLAPRAWANPTDGSVYSFDDFKSSLLILFEIISLEGWVDVMSTAMSVAGKDQQLQNDNRQVNALFFLIYNLIGSTTVLTLFVAVIIENFQQFSGAAFQTAEQRQWIDLKKLILRQKPSRRPKVKPSSAVRAWCYERAVQKNGWWTRALTFLYIVNIIVLMTQQYGDPHWVDQTRDIVYLFFTVIYVIDIVIRLAGLGWTSFKANPWNLYDLLVVLGTLSTTIPSLLSYEGDQFNIQFQKIFLTCVAFKLVQRFTSFNQLFKTARASLPAILSLFLLWLTMFLVWAIMLVEVFGLTKWGENETYVRNFSSLFSSLIFLSMMSTGEGWNTYMHDYTVSPPQCTPADSYLETDCGSESWAYVLFIGWNVISMYIFLNMFTGTVVENFSYLFELGGKPVLSREEMRAYKEAWARFDTNRNGHIKQQDLVPFLRSLTGVFEVDLYPTECSISSLVAALESNTPLASPISPSKDSKSPLSRIRQASPLKSPAKDGAAGEKGHFMWPPAQATYENVTDAQRLARALGKVDAADLRKRRVRFNRIYHEAVLSQHKTKGISFTDMLLILAHHKLVNDNDALGLEELIQRRELVERVDDQVNLERVRGVMKMVYCRRKFLAMRAQSHHASSTPVLSSRPELPRIIINSEGPTLSGPSDDSADAGRWQEQDSFGPSLSRTASPSTPSIAISTSQASLENLEQRASPAIAAFESTAWGDVMRRLSRSEHSHPSMAQGHFNEMSQPPVFADSDIDEEKTSLAPSRT
ncbi:calcium channel protein [Thecaphora frezii]